MAYIPVFVNSNEAPVDATKYHPKLYVRYRGSSEYVLYQEYQELGQEVTFGENEKVVGWYVEIDSLTEGISNGNFSTDLTVESDEFAQNGKIYNFNYLKILQNGTIVNTFDWDDYGNQFTRDTLGNYDVENYGNYLQRSYNEAAWEYHELGTYARYFQVYKAVDKLSPDYDPDTETFNGKYYFYASVHESAKQAYKDHKYNAQVIPEENWITRITYYDLLPMGIEITDTEEEVEASVGRYRCYNSELLYGKDGQPLFNNITECERFVRGKATVHIVENWHETGRTYISASIDFSEKPFATANNTGYGPYVPSFDFNYSISYDDYMEYGREYTNFIYIDADGLKTTHREYNSNTVKDNGGNDAAAVDINENGDTEECLDTRGHQITLLVATSTKQDLKKTVKTEHSGRYVTEAETEVGEDYSYRVRMRTGLNRTMNVVLYDSLETNYGNNAHWQGRFNGVDTSFAETQLDYAGNPLKVKTYYSQNANAGSLGSDSSWQEYVEGTTDKTRVKALAFKLVDQNGNVATLPASSFIYVTVLMKAPTDKTIDTLAYNASRSEWNVIDNATGQPVTTITGIQSNTATVDMRAMFDMTVRKVWSDYDNYYELRPETIRFTLYKGDEVVETKTMNVGDENELTFNGLSTLEKDQYRVEEEAIAEYTISSSFDDENMTYTFTNTVNREAPGEPEPEPVPEPEPEPEPIDNPDTFDHVLRAAILGTGSIAAVAGGAVFMVRRRS